MGSEKFGVHYQFFIIGLHNRFACKPPCNSQFFANRHTPPSPLAHPADDVNAKNSCWLTQFSHDLLLSINGRFSLPRPFRSRKTVEKLGKFGAVKNCSLCARYYFNDVTFED